ncbi:MAG: hypothetical protein Q8M22_11120 [Actinomycetota bacterium]|nr:hypothetical protein [Actinomycetota bacterium]
MARQTSRRRTWIGIALVVGILALSAGAWGLQRWAPFADESAEISWPENVAPVAEYVERTTGLEFDHEVDILFVPNDAKYTTLANGEPAELTQTELDDAAVRAASGRALGLWAGDVSLVDANVALNGSVPYPVTWLGTDNAIAINASSEKSTLGPSLRTELAVALTQALDDQHFHVIDAMNAATSAQEVQVLQALGVGHALWVRAQYLDDLDDDEAIDYRLESAERTDTFVTQVAEVPLAYRALRSSGQLLGGAFVAALDGDPERLTDAFTSARPAALDQVSLPTGKYERPDPLEPISDPPAPSGADVHFSSQLGPAGLFMLAATASTVFDALEAADGWGNDRYTVYTLDGRVCADLHVVADSRDDADRLEAALQAWALARPAASNALLAREGVHVYVSVCDPGPDARQPVPSAGAIDHFFGRSGELESRIELSGKPALAECIAVETFARFTIEQLNGFDRTGDVLAEVTDIEDDCLDRVG